MYNKNFSLDIADIHIIEQSLRHKLSKHSKVYLQHITEEVIMTEIELKENQEEIKKIHKILGTIHNQKIWWSGIHGEFT